MGPEGKAYRIGTEDFFLLNLLDSVAWISRTGGWLPVRKSESGFGAAAQFGEYLLSIHETLGSVPKHHAKLPW